MFEGSETDYLDMALTHFSLNELNYKDKGARRFKD